MKIDRYMAVNLQSFNLNRSSKPTTVWSTYPQLCSTLHRYNAWSILNRHRWSVFNRRQHHEHIYRYVYRDKRAGGDLVTHLRGQKPYRKRYGSGDQRRGAIKNRVSIDERPPIVADKSRIGDWEGDTVIGKNQQGALVTLADRVSRYTLAGLVKSKHANGVTAVIQSLFEPYRNHCHTITFDNGKEFAGHETVAAYLDAAIFFAHPYHSWERGLNENTNGLIRQYFRVMIESCV